MKKFVWRLQKVLDIRIKQEDVLRTQLFELTEQALAVRQEIMLCQMQIRSAAAQLNSEEPKDRLIQQPIFLKYADSTENEISRLNIGLDELENRRQQKLQETIKTRKMRKSLEKLRQNALLEFTYEQNRLEQVELDDIASISTARKIMNARNWIEV